MFNCLQRVNCATSGTGMLEKEAAAYLKEISQYKVLTAAEEQDFARGIAKDDAESRRKLILHNLRLVVSIAKKYTNKNLSFMELVEEGNLGLIYAVERFDPDKGVKFSTYGTHWIKQAINRAIRESTFTIKIPAYIIEIIGKWKQKKEEMRQRNNEEPSANEIAAALDVAPEKINLIKRVLNSRVIHNIQEKQDIKSITDVFTKADEGAPDENSFTLSESEILSKLLNSITEREAEILRWRYGLDETEPKSYNAISKLMNISRERARQLEQQSIKKLHDIVSRSM
jgi:RNA polymerase primary sigma factor